MTPRCVAGLLVLAGVAASSLAAVPAATAGPALEDETAAAAPQAETPAATPPAPTAELTPAPPTSPTSPTSQKPAVRSLRAGGLPADAAALLVSGQEGGSLPFAVLAVPLPGTGERARVAVRIELDGSALLAAPPSATAPAPTGLRPGQAPPLRVEVYLYALDERGRIGDSLVEVVEADLERVGDAVAAGGIALSGELALLPGNHALRGLVRVVGSDELGLRSQPLAVPDFTRGGAAAMPPLVPAPAGAWLEVDAAGGARPEGGRRGFSLLGVTPAARPLLPPGGAATAEVVLWLPGSAAEAASTLRLEARPAAGGGAAVGLPSRVTGRRESGVRDVHVFTVAFEVEDLAPGEYEVAGRLAGREVFEIGRTRLLVAEGGAASWAQLGTTEGATAATGAAATGAAEAWRATRGGRRRAAGPIQKAFRDALGLLAGGDAARAATALRDFEVAALGGPKAIGPKDLAGPELEVVIELAETDREAVVPVLLLYQRLYAEHVAAQRHVPAAHASEMAFTLAQLYAERGGPEARPLAARLLVGLAAAGSSQRGISGFGARALTAAIALDPDNAVGLRCLALEAERRGLYSEAAGYLERLRRLAPEDREVRLRLAVNLDRLDSRRLALRLLEELVAEPGGAAGTGADEDWVTAVAHQELARILLDAGRAADAAETARAGLARLPGDEKLALLHALALDVQGQSAAAREALAAVVPPPRAGGAAPRYRYGQLPAAVFAAARRDLERSAEERLPALAAGLGGRAAPAGRPGGGPRR